jgi:predicted  nucleic acid-binding Zn-ribbon protein
MAKDTETLDATKQLMRKVEQLEATLTGLTALRETYDTRFTMISEKIGEVRSMVLTQAKEGADAKAKAERALMSLEGVKPEEFRAAIIKRDAEVEALKAKFESTNDMIKSLMNEVREFRNALAQFKGLETVMGMADDARKNIIRIQQVRDQVEVMSDKVMSAFLEFQRRFKDVTDLTIKVGALNETIKPLSKTVNQMDVMVKQAVTKADLSKLVGDIEALKNMSQEIKTYHEQLTTKGDATEKFRTDLEKAIRQLDVRNKRELAKINAKIRVMEKAVSKILRVILSTK